MAQTIHLPTPVMPFMIPSSPDPTPLRMLAFSVAEAALSSDPNSPLFFAAPKVDTVPRIMPQESQWDEAFQDGWQQWNGGVKTIAERRGKMVWDVLERARERKEKGTHFIENVLSTSPPVSPGAYNFVLPANSQLAASIARQQEVQLQPTKPVSKRLPAFLYTQSAEPSPTRSTFSGLDQTRPPPEFVPRLTAKEFSQHARKTSVDVMAIRERRRSSIEPLSASALAQHLASTEAPVTRSARRSRLPSLQQIQAKISGTSGHRRSGSVGAIPRMRPSALRTESTDSADSEEVIKTPVDDVPNPLRDRRLALQVIMNRRPSTPPSPSGKEARLSSFLRERTNGRLAESSKVANDQDKPEGTQSRMTPVKTIRPVLKVTPPSFENRPAVPPLHLIRASQAQSSPTKSVFPFRSGFSTPTETKFNHPLTHLATPPSRSGTPSPASPTGSIRSTSTGQHGSPTFNMPNITCTPAPPVVLRDGFEQDSDDGSEASGDVILFDGEAEEREREERERRGMEMRAKLLRRRSSDSE